MHRFTTTFMWLISSFFTWHNSYVFLLKNARGETGFIFPMRTPLPIVDERTAKVRVEGRSLKIAVGNFYVEIKIYIDPVGKSILGGGKACCRSSSLIIRVFERQGQHAQILSLLHRSWPHAGQNQLWNRL